MFCGNDPGLAWDYYADGIRLGTAIEVVCCTDRVEQI